MDFIIYIHIFLQALRFEIMDQNSPFEIFVRELVAMDGVDSSEITLIDSRGCPTDHFIMGPLYKSTFSGKVITEYSKLKVTYTYCDGSFYSIYK